MLVSGKKVFCVLGSIMLCAKASAITDDSANPYQGIVDRNVFGLKPPAPIQKPEPKPSDLPPITLTGMTTILSSKRALLNVQPPGKPLQSFILAEGQRDGDIEVLEIDEKAGSVKVSQGGTIIPLTFEKNGPKLPASVAAPAGPAGSAAPTPIAYGSPLPHANANPYAPAATASGMQPVLTRQVRDNSGVPNYGNGGSPNGMGISTPGFASGQPQSQQEAPRIITPDEQALHMLTQHVQNTDKGIEMPPLPPPLADALQESQGQPSTPSPNSTTPRFPPRSPSLPPLPQ
jgi:hypothetical protein